ncbi:hypothetical protein GWI33_018733 [Rhynchophorus ferrugineus]|uniref:Uncharacterized protein n=1 Tax=Rhynchophorus ferrugineus TaxID=354439 RepID=A0A834HST3_RHYFE|nr:hypothetical protein GWI33_018733 [Rhynchophorus ferrugineus]
MQYLSAKIEGAYLLSLNFYICKNQESNKDDPPKPVRGRGRARFTSAQESNPSAEITTRATSNRRASTRTRIHSNNPKAAADRRAQSIDSPKQYAVHEPNNESPIDSFRRQSKSRVLTENRFDTTSFARRPTTFESSRTSVTPPLTNELPVEVLSQDFGSTARAILQARGETPPPKTTSPRVDQEYLLNNFGSTIRSLAASRSASRGEGPSQRSGALRSENSVPSRRASLKTSLDREPLTRARGDKLLDRSKSESHKSTTEASSFDNLDSVFQAERETEGISEQNDLTETQPFEVSSETVPIETEEFRKTSSVEVSTQKTTEVSEIRRAGNVRRVGVRSKAAVSAEAPSNPAPRVRASRTRSRVDIDTAATVPRGRSSKRQDDVSVAESRKGPSVFMAESTSEVPSRPRPGRRIDNRYEGVPQRVTIDLPTTIRTRVGGRRASVAEVAPTEKSSVRTNTRGRSKSATKSTEPSTNSAPIPIVRSRSDSGDISPSYTRSSNRRSSTVEVQSAPTRNENTRANRPSGRRQSVTENIYQRTSVEVTTPNTPVVQDSSYGARTGRSRIETTTASVSHTSPTGRIRGRFSDGAPKIDESKLEVLPLFEREPKADSSIRSRGQRSRTSISRRQGFAEDRMQVSATEDDVKFVDKPTTAFTRVTVTRTESVEASTSRARLSTRMVSSSTSTTSKVSSSTKSTPTTKRTTTTTTASPTTKKVVPVIKESVVAEVNAVTSKSTITRRKKVVKPTKVPETTARGSKKSEVKLSDVSVKKNGEDEVDEEDNYPEAFKALIQAKKQEESRSSKPSSTRGASTSTEKVFVTSSAPSRSSPVNRIVTTSLPAVSRMPQLVSEIVNESDNELDPKSGSVSTTTTRPTRSRLMPKFSDKTKFNPKSKDRVPKTTTEKPRTTSGEKTLKATSFPRKSFTPKGYSTKAPHEHHLRKKALRSTSFPPATTPIPIARESKFSAKFIRKSEAENAEKNEKRPKGFFSNRKKQNGEEQSRRKLDETTPIPPKKPTSSLFSSRYRSDLPPKTTVLKMATTKPYYVPTIPTPAYIPTIPTLKPSFGQVDQDYVVEKDKDLGIEVISFDEPVNAIPSADLVNGEYLAADKTARLSATVKDGTTEKPISIIERIINSITSISTTAIPDTINLSSSTTTEATENSAILKLAPKKPTTKDKTKLDDKTNTFETLTSEKPTTLIEKILSSLSAIQSNEVGTSEYNTISSPSTTPLSTVTKYSAKYRGSSIGTTSLPAPLFLSTAPALPDDVELVQQNEVLEKRTISKLLDLLNGMISTPSPEGPQTPEELVVVTPKVASNLVTSSLVATTTVSTEPLELISLNEIEPRGNFIDSTPTTLPESTSSVVSTDVNTEQTTMATTVINVNIPSTSLSTDSGVQDSTVTTQASTITTGQMEVNNEAAGASVTIPPSVPPTTTGSTTISPPVTAPTGSPQSESTTNQNSASTSETVTTTQTIVDTTPVDMLTTTPPTQQTTVKEDSGTLSSNTGFSTLPTIPNIEVSPESVSIFSANDLSNTITSNDNLINTVTISSRGGFDNMLTSTTQATGETTSMSELSATSESGVSSDSTTVAEIDSSMSSIVADSTTLGKVVVITTAASVDSSTSSITESSNTVDAVATTEAAEASTTLSSPTAEGTTVMVGGGATTVSGGDSTTTAVSDTPTTTSGTRDATTTMVSTTSTQSPNANANILSLSNRAGRILSNDVGNPVGNNIDIATPLVPTSSTPDYFIFAVLNNNTILRKRPPTIPNKEVPFVIVGLYPNNTVVRKFPNGTLIPMEQVIKVRGFDTRPNPPPLIEITSNQVTDTTNGITNPDNNQPMVDSNREGRLLAVEQTPTVSGSTTRVLSSGMLNDISSRSQTGANVLQSMNSVKDVVSSTTAPSSTTTVSSTTSTTTPSTTSSTSSTTVMNVVEIIAVPGETRISKSQTTTVPQTTTDAPSTTKRSVTETSTVVPTTTLASAATTNNPQANIVETTIVPELPGSQSSEAIPSTLGEILNDRTVDALNNLISSDVKTTTEATNFKTLNVNQYNEVLNIQDLLNRNREKVVYRWKPVIKVENKSIKASYLISDPKNSVETTTISSSSNDAPFTSPVLLSESTTQIPTPSDALIASTSASTLIPVITQDTEITTQVIVTTTPPTTMSQTTSPSAATTAPFTISKTETTTPELQTTTEKVVIVTATSQIPVTQEANTAPESTTLLSSIITTLFPNLLKVTTTESSLATPFTSPVLSTTIDNRVEILSTAGTTAQPSTVLPPTLSSLQLSTSMPVTSIPPTTTQSTTPPAPTTTPSTTTTAATTTTPIPTTTTQRLITTTLFTTVPSKTAAPTEESRSEPTTPMGTKEQTDALFDDLKRSGKLINLNDEQRKNLQEIEKIEKEQAELLKQLTVLAKMFGGPNAKLPNMPKLSNQNPSKPVEDSLANRIISMAIEREKSRSSTSTAPTTTTQAPTTQSTSATTKRPNSIQDQLPITDVDTATKRTTPSLEEILKQYNLNSLSTPSPLGTTYGKSEEALLAAILKDQGIGPTTPKSLADKVKEAGVFEENPTTKASKPKPKSRPQTNSVRPPGGRLMQGLNWLLDLLDPTTKRPVAKKNKPKTPAKKPNTEEELLSNQPTKITPVVTAVPPAKPNLSQEEIQVLIKQLEAVQNDPKAATQLDFSKIKSLQNLIDVNEGVQVTSAGQRGTTLRATARPAKLQATTEADDFVGFNKKVTTTVSTASVSNSIDDDFEFVSTTARTRVIPPVSLNPIPGIDDQGESLIRGNLLTAAVNVTRAISSFLGSALQGATKGFRSLIGSGSSMVGNLAQSSSSSSAG